MDEKDFIAHVTRNKSDEWCKPQSLKNHLEGTAKLTQKFADSFDCGQWGYMLGRFHDVGKARVEWQNYLKEKSGYPNLEDTATLNLKTIPHAIYSAKLFQRYLDQYTRDIPSYITAGHHAGLHDFNAVNEGQGSLYHQMRTCLGDETLEKYFGVLLKPFIEKLEDEKIYLKDNGLALWIRMLFSCLVDADWLDTERYMAERIGGELLPNKFSKVDLLYSKYEAFISDMEAKALNTRINTKRREIRVRCEAAAGKPQGIFNLCVPTGGGKTISSFGFALKHCVKHKLDRVIYVSPFISITEQTADSFGKIIGRDQVVEHHSNVKDEDLSEKLKRAQENWDAPVITTSSVQFFESLFAARPGRCRKLHNIARSVVIIDEAQMIPIEYMSPILEVLASLVNNYHVSVVISTATQPAFKKLAEKSSRLDVFEKALDMMGTQEELSELFRQFERTEFHFPQRDDPMTFDALAEELMTYNQVLCIVNDRKSCKALHETMPLGTYHLSGLMCGQHRSEKIIEIKNALKKNQTVRVISTSLVEAGVDLDFPAVYRAYAGLDSIVQAGGRCNREGYLEKGDVYVFHQEKKPPKGLLRKAYDVTLALQKMDMLGRVDEKSFEPYYQELYKRAISLDAKGILDDLNPQLRSKQHLDIAFRKASQKFKMVEDNQQRTIFVRYRNSKELFDKLKILGPTRELLRNLQRYSVNVYEEDFNMLYESGALECFYEDIWTLREGEFYSDVLGVRVEDFSRDPDLFIL
ncbi:MAG: CRISPR-associated helicase Cas3' [Tissierellales bacterium]|nr:CRISPR-associated helicase Cas3' [Tissierellales bacterium]